MQVELRTKPEHIQDMIENAVRGAQTSHGNKGNEIDAKAFLLRLIGWGHESVLEHIFLTFEITGLSRACLQELARHRLASMTVESTRYTLRKIIKSIDEGMINGVFNTFDYFSFLLGEFAQKERVIHVIGQTLGMIAGLAEAYPEMPNDVLKYFLPEFWPTNLTFSVNIRELRHILDLRTRPAALKEFRTLSRKLFEAVPDEFKYLLADCVHEEVSHE